MLPPSVYFLTELSTLTAIQPFFSRMLVVMDIITFTNDMCFILVDTGLMGLKGSTTEGRKGEAIIFLPPKRLISLASVWNQVGSQPL
jgi:hypothetical protein